MKCGYKELLMKIQGITEDIPYKIANLANISAILFENMDNTNWAGFYLVEDGQLVLGPFQGKSACIVIKKGRGVCGTAWEENKLQLVENVHEFKGHIACDGASNSEIVIPLHCNGEVVGVLDIDSFKLANFSDEDAIGLQAIVDYMESKNIWM